MARVWGYFRDARVGNAPEFVVAVASGGEGKSSSPYCLLPACDGAEALFPCWAALHQAGPRISFHARIRSAERGLAFEPDTQTERTSAAPSGSLSAPVLLCAAADGRIDHAGAADPRDPLVASTPPPLPPRGDPSVVRLGCRKELAVDCQMLVYWSCGAVERERTLAMIKPDGLSGNYTEKIKEAILESGFDIVKETVVHLDVERASLFYAEHSERSFFNSLVKYITSIRAMCGLDSEKNCVHGSDSQESAAREISFFFGDAGSETVAHDEL
ncbi:hypothetical protein PR202_ga01739 [Eleusine coracana subsp. coracana]|uniref:Nucleoside diphosphate kinase-like domain-containing protein n=1 Tax=Eleusine coracana subsp. coracana TaxID=191504 RepID=A0AAV5BJQ3_ELECO|nr:hypothetical protein PR202_ga01052 [Eleusine coracana subsp. coracana]GJM85930.1 hypothetical protein PR202_ga01739 [Eleusine coracana subsp. coracana]